MSSNYECMYLIPTVLYDKFLTHMDEHEKNKVEKLNKTENTTYLGNEDGAFPDLPDPPDNDPEVSINNDNNNSNNDNNDDNNDNDDDDDDDDRRRNYRRSNNTSSNTSTRTQNSLDTIPSPPSSPFITTRPVGTSTPKRNPSENLTKTVSPKKNKNNNKTISGIIPLTEIRNANEPIPSTSKVVNLPRIERLNVNLNEPIPSTSSVLNLPQVERLNVSPQKETPRVQRLNVSPKKSQKSTNQSKTISPQRVTNESLVHTPLILNDRISPLSIQSELPTSSDNIIKRKKKIKSFRCKICKENFGYVKDLNIHLLTKHPKSQQINEISSSKYRCNICDIDFEQKNFLTEHERYHKNKSKSKSYSEWVNDNNDMLSSDDEAINRDLININSGDESINRDVIDLHSHDDSMPMQTLTTADDDGYFLDNYDITAVQCKLCPSYFNNQKNLERHLKNVHDSNKNYVSWLDKGEKRKRSNSSKYVKKTKYDYNLEKPDFLCKLCDMSFTNKKSLERHIKNLHNSNKDYVSWLNKGTKRKISESIGKVSENTQRKKVSKFFHKCKLCNTNFSRKDVLIRHIKNIHSANENYISSLQQGTKRKDVA